MQKKHFQFLSLKYTYCQNNTSMFISNTDNYFLKSFLILLIGLTTSILFGQNMSFIKKSNFNDFIKKAEADKVIINYFNVAENVKLISRDEISIFLKIQ